MRKSLILRIFSTVLIFTLAALPLCSCGAGEAAEGTQATDEITASPVLDPDSVLVACSDIPSKFVIVFPSSEEEDGGSVSPVAALSRLSDEEEETAKAPALLADIIADVCGSMPAITGEYAGGSAFIFISDPELSDIETELPPEEDGDAPTGKVCECFALRAEKVGGEGEDYTFTVSYKSALGAVAAVSYIKKNFLRDGVLALPKELDLLEPAENHAFRYTARTDSAIQYMRDPFVLAEEDDGYYVYGTGWVCLHIPGDDLAAHTDGVYNCVTVPEDCNDNKWAPEVHKYNGSYYMFTTYHSSVNQHRGCAIFRSDSPKGPFVNITDGFITPKDWDSIDGTLYIDPDGQPWMVFVHEWTSTDDGVGRMAAAKLSDDFTRFVSEPVELFRADAPKWGPGDITDGPFLYTTKSGALLMIWSNSSAGGYSVFVARSEDGTVTGKWTQDESLLFSRFSYGDYDGGHGMIFKGHDGKTYLAIHSPNGTVDYRSEKPVFIEIEEQGDTIVIPKDGVRVIE